MNNSMSIKEIKFKMKNLPSKITLGPDDFNMNSYFQEGNNTNSSGV